MGLDQYLYARKHLAGYDFYGEEAAKEFAKVKEAAGMSAVKSELPVGVGLTGSVTMCVAYWRKANAIHGWFVRSFGNGEDDCSEIRVPREGLESLLHLCEGLLADKNAAIAGGELPPTEGFFFGSYEIDEWYWRDLEVTVSQLKSILNDWFPRSDEHKSYVEFVYQASW